MDLEIEFVAVHPSNPALFTSVTSWAPVGNLKTRISPTVKVFRLAQVEYVEAPPLVGIVQPVVSPTTWVV